MLRAADEQRSMRAGALLIVRPRDLLGAKMRRGVVAKIAGVVRIERTHRVLRILLDVQVAGDGDLEVRRAMAGLRPGAPVELDVRGELRRRHPDIRQRQRQPERARPDRTARCSPGPDPDRQSVLQRTRRNRRILEGRAKAALPGHALGRIELQEQIELFREQLILIRQVVAEQRKRLGEHAATGDHLRASA